ncbi:TRAUB-domain-containing protein [Xylariaceae sp. FL0662B]|nr:TRAUB-domain-containing protein [Xylariaceae sp. FL0662B]
MGEPKGRADRFSEWAERPVKDFDPEAENVPDETDISGSEESADENAGTEHYVNVGKSKLRHKDPVALGPQYRGARVTRAALDEGDTGEDSEDASSSDYEDAREAIDGDEEDEFDDPDMADLEADQDGAQDAEIDSDDAFDESDEEKFKGFVFRGSSKTIPKRGTRVTRPTTADYMGSDEEVEGEAGESDDDGAKLDGEDNSDEDILDDEATSGDEEVGGFIDDEAEEEEQEEAEDDDGDEEDDYDDDEEDEGIDSFIDDEDDEGRDVIDGMTSSLSAAAQRDVAKGKAVQQQRKAFDALLNIRIRLQKSLVAVNSFNLAEESTDRSEPYEAAEAAALKLWNAIDDFRTRTQFESSGKTGKRKRSADTDTSSQAMWEDMEAVEQRAIARRRAVLEKWSHSARNIRAVDRSSRKFTSVAEKPLTTRLEEELDAPERLIKRTRTPRSCAPAQVARKVNEDPEIYDDADFYQLLLKELVDQRTGDASGAGGPAATIRFAAVKEAKAKRHVDTRASKGRKMRFNVHDKLQNFMAPEDRRSWEQSAIDRFFGTLFGQKLVLHEDEDEVSDEEMGGVPIDGKEVPLFRS